MLHIPQVLSAAGADKRYSWHHRNPAHFWNGLAEGDGDGRNDETTNDRANALRLRIRAAGDAFLVCATTRAAANASRSNACLAERDGGPD